jgi:hypothetical protein
MLKRKKELVEMATFKSENVIKIEERRGLCVHADEDD